MRLDKQAVKDSSCVRPDPSLSSTCYLDIETFLLPDQVLYCMEIEWELTPTE